MTITCTPLPDQGGMRIDIDWSALPNNERLRLRRSDGTTFTLVRPPSYATPLLPPLGGPYTSPVEYMPTSCGTLVVFDFELPHDTPVTYQVDNGPGFGNSETTTPCTLSTPGQIWLKDPVRPCLNVPMLDSCDIGECPFTHGVIWIGHDREVYSAASAQFDVVGDPRPVDISNVRKDAVTTLQFVTVTCDDRDSLLALTAPGTPIFMPAMPQYCWPARYLALGDHTITPLVRDLRRQPRLHTIPAIVVNAPPGPVCCVTDTSWCEQCDRVGTWDEMDALGLTGVDILHGQGATV